MTSLLPGIRALGGTFHVETIAAPWAFHGDGQKSTPIVVFRKPDGSLWAEYEERVKVAGERSQLPYVDDDLPETAAKREGRAVAFAQSIERRDKDLTGVVKGDWTILMKHSPGSGYKSARWVCRHKCGHVATYAGSTIYHGISPRCHGCGVR